ncbi:hypothetical protein SAMN02746089_00083 [Caldanaerobius fijiensis DSM 17918]|uniref:Alpha-glucosidase n=1 Tax=Caldanaerobius fijiensis DSM 17918 TaxID=1121256 RepID=A0A1M4SN71_9THEO|nr:hypothetical protein [Caldanaerobius fijiensis]SHE33670.1 hypothetical protein SAMN02746089_00083 [Caldanaerobius fijiensis DSM 17918]
MDKKALFDIIRKLKEEIETIPNESIKKRWLCKITEIENIYENIVIPESSKNVYNSIIKNGNELLKLYKRGEIKNIIEKTNLYIKYLKAASYDFKNEADKIIYYVRSFLIMSILFFALSPQYFGFLLPMIFLIPVYIGLRGIKKRSSHAFRISLTLVPVSIMVSVTWIRFFIYALSHYSETVRSTATNINVSASIAKMLVIVPGLLSVVLLFTTLLTAFLGYRYKDYFV